MPVVSSLASDNFWKILGGFRWFRLFQGVPSFSKYMDVLINKCRLARAYPGSSVGRRGV